MMDGRTWTRMITTTGENLDRRGVFCLGMTLLCVCFFPAALPAQAPQSDTALTVLEIAFDTARLGENPFQARVQNRSDSWVLALLDLRAVPGMWMIPNMQKQFWTELAPGEVGVIEGAYEFRRLSTEATLRVMVGPGEPRGEGVFWFRQVEFRETYDVGEDSPDAYDPDDDFVRMRRSPLEIYAWRGSLADRHLEDIALERLEAVRAIEELLLVKAPERIRLVLYADEETKIEQTGHRGVGWARGTTLVEVYNEEVQLDPYHELVHVIAGAAGSPPPVLSEGLAMYLTERFGAHALGFLGFPDTSLKQVMCELQGTPDYIPIDELLALDNIGSAETRAGREYAEAGSFVAHLVEKGGLGRFREVYRVIEADSTLEENRRRIHGIYGAPLEEIEREWLEALAGSCPTR